MDVTPLVWAARSRIETPFADKAEKLAAYADLQTAIQARIDEITAGD